MTEKIHTLAARTADIARGWCALNILAYIHCAHKLIINSRLNVYTHMAFFKYIIAYAQVICRKYIL